MNFFRNKSGYFFLKNAILGNDLLIDGDGEDSLDFTYIDDLLQGVEKIINSKNSINQTFNITYGKAQTLYSFVINLVFNPINYC